MAHTEQHQQNLIKHFGSAIASQDLLQKMLMCTPRILVHFYWFAKEYLPDLACVANFPKNCAAAYKEFMEVQRKKIGADMEAMFARICPEPAGVSTPTDEHGALMEAFDHFCKQVQQLVNQSERDFKNYKKAVNEWEKKKQQLRKAVENKKANHRPQEEIERAEKSLEEHIEKKLPLKWMIDARDFMGKPTKMQESKKLTIFHYGDSHKNHLLLLFFSMVRYFAFQNTSTRLR